MKRPNQVQDLQQRVLAAVAQACPRQGRVAVGVSGGLDSMVLVEALRRLGKPLLCLHVNHGWRGRQSDGDERFVRQWCRTHALDCVVKKLPAGLPRTEAAARSARWHFFSTTLKRRRIKSLCLAHHADDLVETFFLQLLRGAGPDGLASLWPRREWDGMVVLRPLLAFGKAELQALAQAWQLTWREDDSNQSEDYFRNRVRRRLLPYLKRLSGRDPLPIIWRTAQILAAENAFWEQELPRVWPARLAVKLVAGRPVAWQRRALRGWLTAQQVTNADFDQVEAIRELLTNGSKARVNLAGGRFCRRRAGFLFIEAGK